MANVAGVSQLMETVGTSTTQAASPSPTPGPSFASLMRQANTDAGAPLAPVEQPARAKVQAKRTGMSQAAGKQEEVASARGSGQGARPSAADAVETAASNVTPRQSVRYTPANMLSAMVARTGIGPALNSVQSAANIVKVAHTAAANTSIANSSIGLPLSQPLQGAGALSPVAPPVSSTVITAATQPNNDASAQVAIVANTPLDLSAPVVAATTVSQGPGKSNLKTDASSTNTPVRTAMKQDAAMNVTGAPLAVVRAATDSPTPVAATASTTSAAVVANTDASTVVPAVSVAVPTVTKAAASYAATISHPATGQSAAAIATPGAVQILAKPAFPSSYAGLSTQAASSVEQAGAVSFRQSLAATQMESVTATVTNMVTSPLALERPLPAAATKQPTVATVKPTAVTSSGPQVTSAASLAVAAPAPLSTPSAQGNPTQSAAAVLPVAVPAATSQPTIQTPVVTKIAGKPSLSVDAPQPTASATSLTAVQPATSTVAASTVVASTDGKAAPHAATPVIATVPAPAVDGSTPVATLFPVAHTPVAVTALSNAGGPVLATGLATGSATLSASTTTAEPIQHTTLSSTPTTLEVGVASGTHGWLKIRAELNASGTVDASLTGANAAATGRLHNDLPALSSFLQDERVAVGSLNVAAPGTASAPHTALASTIEPTSSFTRSAAEGVGATGTAVASDAGAPGGRAPQQQASESSPGVVVTREADGVAGAITTPLSSLYGDANDLAGADALSEGGGGGWLNIRV